MIAAMPSLRTLGRDLIAKIRADNVTRQAAAVAYYALFSLPSFLLLLIALAGLILGDGTVRLYVYSRIDAFVVGEAAGLLRTVVDGVAERETNLVATLVGAALLAYSGTAILRELRVSLDAILGQETRKRRGWSRAASTFLLSPAIFLACVVCFVFTIAFTALLALLHDKAALRLTGISLPTLSLINDTVTLAFIAGIVFLLYRALPTKHPPLLPSAIGALAVTLVAALSRWILSIYVGYAHVGAAYGVAASALILAFSLYYSILIFLLGAELIDVLVRHAGVGGHRKKPARKSR
jgi:membrane protein